MGKMLIVAEKPSVARDIASAMGGFSKTAGGWLDSDRLIITSGIGHLVESHAPEAEISGKDLATLPVIPARFALRPIERTKAQFTLVSKLMRRADVDCVVNACDAGREGELIFRLTYELAGCKKPMKRMWLQSMTTDAIREAWRTLRAGSEFDALADAARCRSEADWLIGINGSRGITRLRERQTQRYESMSAGRVQTPTLAMIVQREAVIRGFVPKDYWEVHAVFGVQAGRYVGKWFDAKAPTAGADEAEEAGNRLWKREQAEAIVARCRGVAPTSVKDESRATTSAPPKLFDLTSLQREANRRFRLSAKQTLDIAQALYEKHKATTYPRTDSTALPEDYLDKSKEVLGAFRSSRAYGEHAGRVLDSGWVRLERRIFDNTKISDHFAIIPTGSIPEGLSEDEAKIYDMVVRRFVAVFHPAAEYHVTQRTTVVAGEFFRSSGKVLVKPGWLLVYAHQAEKDDTPALCAVAPNELVRTERVDVKALQTKPPARFTEATLLTAMESAGKLVEGDELREAMKGHGLGTPATRAAIIEGLLADHDGQNRPKTPYIVREGKEQFLVPTDKGNGLISFLETNGLGMLASAALTGEWELALRRIEQGLSQRPAFMAEIAQETIRIIDAIRRKAQEMPVPVAQHLDAACPTCGAKVLANNRTFECVAGCGFKLWREIAQRELSNNEAAQLLRDGVLGPLDGFVSKKNKKFSAALRLQAGKVAFVFDEPAATGRGAASPELGVPCPVCSSALKVQGDKFRKVICANTGGCEFSLQLTVAGVPLSEQDARTLIQEGALPSRFGFMSRAGKKFSAGLRLTGLGKTEFVFGD
jgi:DNA topoisomerase-3